MTNETFGMTFRYAACKHYKIDNNISIKRIDDKLLNQCIKSKIIPNVFKRNYPAKFLSDSKECTSDYAGQPILGLKSLINLN
jgi:hypothetical protein